MPYCRGRCSDGPERDDTRPPADQQPDLHGATIGSAAAALPLFVPRYPSVRRLHSASSAKLSRAACVGVRERDWRLEHLPKRDPAGVPKLQPLLADVTPQLDRFQFAASGFEATWRKTTMADGKFLTPEEVSERYRGGISVGTLRNWRAMRIGPTFVKIGKTVLYPVVELDAWDQKNIVTCRASRRLSMDASETA